jgi:uncharacterized protein (TIGR02145 family)
MRTKRHNKKLKLLALILFCAGLSNCHTNTVKDIDGNVYPAVTIGTQVWMAENLKTTRYCNGDSIGTTTPSTFVIEEETSPRYQWAYNGNESNVATYGRLYTWYVATDGRRVCPAGWHIPADSEWTVLTDYLIQKGSGFGGGYKGMDISKSLAATSGWVADDIPGSTGNDTMNNNSTGFTALPGGARLEDGKFYDLGHVGTWWSATERGKGFMQALTGIYVNIPGALFRDIYHDYCYVNSYVNNKKYGMSVRCIKDD